MSHAASLEFFETGILEAANLITTPFAQRVEILKFNEPAHAISHLIEQAQIVENTLKECIQMCSFVLEKHKEVIDDFSNLQVQLDQSQEEVGEVRRKQEELEQALR